MEPQAIAILVLVCIVAGVIPIVTVVGSIIYLIHFMSPDDKWRAWVPKFVFVFSFTLGILSILIMPLDIANVNLIRSADFNFALGIIWQVFYGVVALMVIVVIPYATCYYEAEDSDLEGITGVLHQTRWAICYTLILVVFTAIVIGVTYPFFGYAQIPYVALESDAMVDSIQEAALMTNLKCDGCYFEKTSYDLFVSIIIYLAGYMSLIGWIFFVIFGGCGLSALPIRYIKGFIKRPKMIKSDEFQQFQKDIQKKAEKLVELGEELAKLQESDRWGTKTRSAFNQFKMASLQLENNWEEIQKRYYKGGGSIILAIFQLIYGIIAGLVSLVWVAHLVLYLIIPQILNVAGLNDPFQFGFLNYLMFFADQITGSFPIIGACLYAFFSFHIILAVLSGIEILGRRFTFVNAHPLKPGKTLMNSLLFNVGIFLLCAVTTTQFTSDAFSQYARQTALQTMFGVTIKYLRYVTYFFQWVHIAFLISIIIGTVLSILDACCNTKSKETKDLEEIIRSIRA